MFLDLAAPKTIFYEFCPPGESLCMCACLLWELIPVPTWGKGQAEDRGGGKGWGPEETDHDGPK